MKSVVCFGDCLMFAKCIIFCVHWLLGFQTPTLTVANKPPIYYLKQIIRQWIVWSALVTASYLLTVLSSVFNGCLHVRLLLLTVPNKPQIFFIKANYKTMDCVVCFGDCLIYVHWFPACKTPIT